MGRMLRLTSLMLALVIRLAAAQTIDPSALKSLQWRSIGPAVMGGRIDDIAVVERNTSIIYVAAASGGLWKTTNSGTTWEPIFDNEAVASIGDVAVASSSPDVVWVGTGEPNNRQSSTFGDGVYKSIDGGRTWKHMGLRETQHIGRIVIDSVDPDVVYVAALGRLWGPNKERGLFKTTDGGLTWTNTKFIDADTGFADVVMDPFNRQVLYATAYQRRRVPWGFNGGGPGSGIYKTADGGKTWRELTKGLPDGPTGRIGLDVSRSQAAVVYATVENRKGGTFRSDDAGESWQRMSDVNPRPMYYSQIRVDPTNDRRVYILGSLMYVSDDGARTFADPKTGRPGPNNAMAVTYDVGVHGDHHALWIDAANPSHLILGNDGGLYFSFDGSISWDKVNNIPLGQFYGIGVDMQKPYNIYGGLQDTHSWGGPSATRYYVGITNSDWFEINFGDGMYAQVDPKDPDTIYTESQDGNLVRFHRATGDRKSIKPYPNAGEPPYRFNWTAPLQISPHDSRTLYFGGNRLFKSTDRGDTWATVSPDLTKAEDRDKLPIMGVLPSSEMLSRNDGVSAWGTITSLAESAVMAGVLWVGTDDGNVQVSRDGGATWTNVTDRIPGIAKKGRVSRVEPSRRDARTAYVSCDRHQDDDFAPYIFVTTDFGQTWKAIAGDLPRIGWVNVVREHPANPRFLLAGTETGVFFTLNGGGSWMRLKNNLPTVPVDDLVIHPRDNDLILGTHGRSIYVLDDISALSGLTPEILAADAHLVRPRPAAIVPLWKHESYGGQRQFVGPNPPQGAIIDYYLKARPNEPVTVTITSGSDTSAVSESARFRTIAGSAEPGINRVVWDLRHAPPEEVPNGRGPFVLPGKYRVTLSAGGRTYSAPLEVQPDPALRLSDEDREARRTFLLKVNGLQSAAQRAVATATDLGKQAASLVEQLKKLSSVPAAVLSSAEALEKDARGIRRRLAGGQVDAEGSEGGGGGGGLRARVNGLFGEVDGAGVQQGSLTAPSAVQQQRLRDVSAEFDATVGDLNRAIKTAVPSLNLELNRSNVPRLHIPPVGK